jgi:5-methylthioadenosine/S-adenosylhomocysteine deaminase
VNLDRLTQPKVPGSFLELKSRTWSSQDAEHKAELISELLAVFGVEEREPVGREYLDFVKEGSA